ncbi:MAG: hypothetical protein ABIO16_02780 [Nocardioides sp.]
MRVAIVPGVLALLPEYAGQVDPVPEVRAAALAAVAWLAEQGAVTVVADEQGARVGRHLLDATGAAEGDGASYLVVANGSARRNDTAPGYVDDRAVPCDAVLDAALRKPDPDALAATDVALGSSLLVGNPAGLVRLGTLLRGADPALVDYADDPYGVQYWVMRWVVTDPARLSEGK